MLSVLLEAQDAFKAIRLPERLVKVRQLKTLHMSLITDVMSVYEPVRSFISTDEHLSTLPDKVYLLIERHSGLFGIRARRQMDT